MFKLMHEMRVRIMTAHRPSPGRQGDRRHSVRTDHGRRGARARRCPSFLWKDRGVVPFLKVDKGLAAEQDGVSLMKPIPGLDTLLERAVKLGVFGTKMRSVINLASQTGIAANVAQQFELADQIASHGLMPIIEPEVSIKSPDKPGAEAILLEELTKKLDSLAAGTQVMLKLTIPTVPDLYMPLIKHKNVMRVVALSGGYSRRRRVSSLGRKSRHDCKLFPRPDRTAQTPDERRRVRCRPWCRDRRNLPGIGKQDLKKDFFSEEKKQKTFYFAVAVFFRQRTPRPASYARTEC